MLPIFVVLFSFPAIVLSLPFFTKFPVPSPAFSPESLDFDSLGQGPYTGISDGRIIKYQGPNVGFQDYAVVNPNRSKEVCDGYTDAALGPVCGRPLGLEFYKRTGELFIADVYLGLVVVGTDGTPAKLATTAEGVPFLLLDGLAVDQLTGIVYFTDYSERFTMDELEQAIFCNDSTGRLLKYDPNTKNVTVLLRGLSGPGGVQVAFDSSFVLISEHIGKRIQKYWLEGPKANTSEILINLPGRPDNIMRTASGDFLVAVNVDTSPAQTNVPTAMKINSFGKILANVSLSREYNTTTISTVREFGGAVYIGTLSGDFVGKYQLLEHPAGLATS